MNSELPPPQTTPPAGFWTAPRAALAAVVLALVALTFPTGCNPTDSTANVSTAPPRPAAKANPATRTPAAPAPLPEKVMGAELTALDGKGFTLADYSGKVLVMNAWASWCGPCRAEIPEFIKINDEYKARGVEFIGVTAEDDRGNTPEAVREFVKEYEINYRIAWADDETWEALLSPSYGIPQTYILGRDGRVLERFRGYNAQIGQRVRAAIDRALAEKQG